MPNSMIPALCRRTPQKNDNFTHGRSFKSAQHSCSKPFAWLYRPRCRKLRWTRGKYRVLASLFAARKPPFCFIARVTWPFTNIPSSTWIRPTMPNLVAICQAVRAYLRRWPDYLNSSRSVFNDLLKVVGTDTDWSGTYDFLKTFHISAFYRANRDQFPHEMVYGRWRSSDNIKYSKMYWDSGRQTKKENCLLSTTGYNQCVLLMSSLCTFATTNGFSLWWNFTMLLWHWWNLTRLGRTY